MRWFWQKEKSAPKREVPDTALREYSYLWRISDHKRFEKTSDGLYVASDGERINLYEIQKIRWAENLDFIFAHQGEHFPFGQQYYPKMPMPREQELLKQLDQVDRHHHGAK